MSSVKLGSALRCFPMLHHWATRTLYGERGPLRSSCVFVPRSWQDEKNLFPYFFNELKSLIWTAKNNRSYGGVQYN